MQTLSLPPIRKIHEEFKAGKRSPVALLKQCLEQIDKHNPEYNAFVLVERDFALRTAEESERRFREKSDLGLLDGIPFTVKDLLDVQGFPTLKGSQTTDDTIVAVQDSPAVARLKENGAIFLGKTTTCEFGHKGVCDSERHGITRNPHHREKTSGGSSGGAAVASWFDMGILHVGNDGGGSLRIPAAFCGVTGFKPSYGTVPETAFPYGTTQLVQTGLIAKHADDIWIGMGAIAENQGQDWNTIPKVGSIFQQPLNQDKKLKIAFSRSLNDFQIQPDIADSVSQAIKRLEDQGHNVTEIKLDEPDLLETIATLWMAGIIADTRSLSQDELGVLDPSTQKWLDWAKKLLTLETYIEATEKRQTISRRIERIFKTYDVLITPTLPILPFDATLNSPPEGERMNLGNWWTPLTAIANLAGLPAVSIPCGETKTGFPVGLQVMAARFEDKKIFDLISRF